MSAERHVFQNVFQKHWILGFLGQRFEVRFCSGVRYTNIANEFAWLVHVRILDGVEKKKNQKKKTATTKNKSKAFVELQ